MPRVLKTIAKYIIGWPLSFVAIIFIISKILPDSDLIRKQMLSSDLRLLLIGIFCFMMYYFLRSLLWRQILSNLGSHLPLRQTAFSWSISELNRYIPGNVWSFVSRTYLFSSKNIKKEDIVRALFIEAQLILLGSVLTSLFSIPFLAQYLGIRFFDGRLTLAVCLLVASLLAVFFVLQTRLKQYVHPRLQNIYGRLFDGFSESQNFSVLILSFLAFLFFGLGYFFTISSVVHLTPILVLSLTGFFILALLIGYISFVTPTGLGVREGIITYGLAGIVGVTLAGFAAIFSRIILIISEVLFIGIAYIYMKTHTKLQQSIEHFVIQSPYETMLIFAMTFYTVFFTWVSFLRHDNFYTGRFDLGNMAQTVWNTMHGRIFELTNPNGVDIVSRLAFHADFLLILLTPFYSIWPHPKTLLFLQTFVIAFGAFFVYKIATRQIGSKSIALVLSFAYLLNPSVQRVNLYDFHAVSFATTFLLASWYFLQEKKSGYFVLFLFLAGISKEQVWLIAGLLGLYAWIGKGYKRLGLSIAVVSFFLFYFLIWYAIPSSLGSKHFALEYYSDFGDSPTSVVKGLILRPDLLIREIATQEKIDYLKQLFLPVGYLPLLSPLYLIFILPDLLINLLSKNPQLHQIYYQYTATITPFLFIATIQTIRRIKFHNPLLPNKLISLFLFIAVFYTSYAVGPLPYSNDPNVDMITHQIKIGTTIEDYLAKIPQVYSVAATNNIGSHVAHRPYLFTLPVGLDTADIVILLHTRNTDFGYKEYRDYLTYLSNSENRILLFEEGDFHVFKKRAILTRKY